MIITAEQFTGFFKIAQDPQSLAILTSYIERYEKQYLIELFGYDLYVLFEEDLTDSEPIEPQTERFTVVFEELNYEGSAEPMFYRRGFTGHKNCFCDDNKTEVEPTLSRGIVDMLLGFIFYEFVKEYDIQVSQTGLVINANENSTPLPGALHTHYVESRYNQSVNSYKVIRRYMMANSTTYPEYKGVEKETTYWGGAI